MQKISSRKRIAFQINPLKFTPKKIKNPLREVVTEAKAPIEVMEEGVGVQVKQENIAEAEEVEVLVEGEKKVGPEAQQKIPKKIKVLNPKRLMPFVLIKNFTSD